MPELTPERRAEIEARTTINRLGRSMWRETDKDILAIRDLLAEVDRLNTVLYGAEGIGEAGMEEELYAAKHELAKLKAFEAEYLEMTSSLGFGDDRTEPAATPEDLREWFSRDMAEARDHQECPVICEHCGEWLAKEWCPECKGSGMRPSSNEHQYGECEYCAGDLKVHVRCVQRSYADLAADAATLRQLTEQADASVIRTPDDLILLHQTIPELGWLSVACETESGQPLILWESEHGELWVGDYGLEEDGTPIGPVLADSRLPFRVVSSAARAALAARVESALVGAGA